MAPLTLERNSLADEPDSSMLSKIKKRDWQSAQQAGSEQYWSEEDQKTLEDIWECEISLWKACFRFFDGQTPMQVLQGLSVESSSTKNRDINWSQSFCVELRSLLCCPYLQNGNVLLYAIKKAMHCRHNQLPAPDRSLLRNDRNGRLIDRFQEWYPDILDGDLEKLKKLLDDELGSDTHPHSRFVNYIRNAVAGQGLPRGRYASETTAPGIILRDIKAVATAWDEYADREHHRLELKKMKDYQAAASRNTKSSIGTREILKLKKEAIIAQRQKNDLSQRASPGEERTKRQKLAETTQKDTEEAQKEPVRNKTANPKIKVAKGGLAEHRDRGRFLDNRHNKIVEQGRSEQQNLVSSISQEVGAGMERDMPANSNTYAIITNLDSDDESLAPIKTTYNIDNTSGRQDKHVLNNRSRPSSSIPSSQSKQRSSAFKFQEKVSNSGSKSTTPGTQCSASKQPLHPQNMRSQESVIQSSPCAPGNQIASPKHTRLISEQHHASRFRQSSVIPSTQNPSSSGPSGSLQGGRPSSVSTLEQKPSSSSVDGVEAVMKDTSESERLLFEKLLESYWRAKSAREIREREEEEMRLVREANERARESEATETADISQEREDSEDEERF